MGRRPVRALVTALLMLCLPATASAAASVHATVTVRNATPASLSSWTVRVTLAKGTRLSSATATRPDRRTSVVALKGRAALKAGASRTLRVLIRGSRVPRRWTFASRACSTGKTTRRGSIRRVSVRCTTQSSPGTSSTPVATSPSPGSSPGSTPKPATPASPGASPAWFRFAPYADMAGYPAPDLAAARTGGGVKTVTLGFVTARASTDCVATWGGYAEYPATGSGAYQLASVQSSRAAGGDVVISFGGAAGAELATVCSSVDALTSAYAAVIDAYGATHVDFDVEGAAITNTAANARRAQAIVALQQRAAAAGKTLAVAYTLPVQTGGLDADGLAVLRDAISRGVLLSLVNVMAMDYGDADAPSPSGKMGQYAIDAATATAKQLGVLLPSLSAADVLARIGVTPMIGVNDVQSETFTVADAQKLVAWAGRQHIGALAMWALGRDRQCASPQTAAQDDCSSVGQSAWDFSKALGAFAG